MAATYVQVSIAGVNKQAIVVDGTGATERIILQETLTDYDQEIMDNISNEAGASFFAKMQAHTLANGLNAADVYANFILFTEAYSDLVDKAKVDVYARLTSLEDRVTALENP